jgi:hypothetical protein
MVDSMGLYTAQKYGLETSMGEELIKILREFSVVCLNAPMIEGKSEREVAHFPF